MTIKNILKTVLKLALLTLLMVVLFTAGTALSGVASLSNAGATPAGASQRLLALLIISLVETLLLSYFVVRSQLSGLWLVAATAVLYYGIKTFTAQIETAYFVSTIPRTMLPGLFMMTIPTALIWPAAAALLFGKLRGRPREARDARLTMPPGEWAWKALLVGTVIYPVLLFGAGYFIAWRNPDVRAFYGGVDNPNVIAYYANMFAKDPVVYPFEVMRGVLWFLLALPVVLTVRDRPWAIALLVATLFALLENTQHLMPNPFMPDAVRLTHFVETASSNFVLGLAVVGLIFWHPTGQRKSQLTPAGQM